MLRLRLPEYLVFLAFARLTLAAMGLELAEEPVECGRRNQTTVWPFHVGLYREEKGSVRYFCGGTIVDRWHVVGSAHCVSPYAPEVLSVRYGTYDLAQTEQMARCRIAKIIVHPGYQAPDFRNDVALLRLADPLPIGPLAQPVCLLQPPANDSLLPDPEGTLGVSVGWGIGPHNIYSNVLLLSEVETSSQKRCMKVFTAALFGENEFFCAVTPVCSGSGGSGFYVRDGGRYFLHGMTTFGVAPRGSNICGLNTLTGLLNMQQYTSWMQQHIAQHRAARGTPSLLSGGTNRTENTTSEALRE